MIASVGFIFISVFIIFIAFWMISMITHYYCSHRNISNHSVQQQCFYPKPTQPNTVYYNHSIGKDDTTLQPA